MMSGSIVCFIQVTPSMLVADVKESVREQTGVPADEQHLCSGGRELCGEVPVTSLGTWSLSLMRWPVNPLITNLGYFHVATNFQPLPHGAFTRISKLAAGIHGNVYAYAWRHEGHEDRVAVKKLRNEALGAAREAETDERMVHLEASGRAQPAEDPLAEIGILRYLARQPDLSPYLLRIRGVFMEDRHTWLVTEYAEGGELFGVAAAGPISESTVRTYAWQLLQAVAYLHRRGIGHRDISLENVLLRGNCVQLADFGMAVRSCTASGVPLRFFRTTGKDYHRAPEVYVPTVAKLWANAPEVDPEDRTALVRTARGYLCELRFPPEAVPGEACLAEVWGYAAAPADVFAVGVCLFILTWRCPPWRRALLADRGFAYVHHHGDAGITALLRHFGKPFLAGEAMQLVTEMLRSDPTRRPSAAECLASVWFSEEAMGEDYTQSLAEGASAVRAESAKTPVHIAAPGGA